MFNSPLSHHMKRSLLFFCVLFFHFSALTQLHVSNLFSDHMVLQRSQPVPVWGTASVNETLTIQFDRQSKITHADKNGRWMVMLDPQPAGGPYELNILGKDSLVFRDVYVGEVWICFRPVEYGIQAPAGNECRYGTGAQRLSADTPVRCGARSKHPA